MQPGSTHSPSIIVVHGGGWTSGSRIAHVGQILEFLTGAGYNWFSIDYRLDGLGHFDDSLADIRAAVSFIRCHAKDLRIDPNQLLLLGEDSGAHLAALLAAEPLPGVIGSVLIGGFYDLNSIPSVSRESSRDGSSRASPLARTATVTRPLLVIHGGADSESPTDQARSYCDAVVKSGGRCQLVEIAGASHRSENWWPNQWHYKQTMAEWLAKVGRSPAVPHRTSPGSLRRTFLTVGHRTWHSMRTFRAPTRRFPQ